MTTTFEQMKAAMDAATEGEWRHRPLYAPYGGDLLADEIRVGDAANAPLVAADVNKPEDAAAIVAALNWLRGGGIAQFEAMREAAATVLASWDERCREREHYVPPRDDDELPGYWSPSAAMVESAAIAKLRAALAATEGAK